MELNKKTKLPSKVRLYWLTKLIFLIACFSLLFSLPFKGSFGKIFGFLIVFPGLPVFLYLLLYYNAFSFVIEENKITINSGVIIKKSRSIPFNAVQNVENVRGILRRMFGLSTVKIWTSSPEQIKVYKGTASHKPDATIELTIEDGEWLKNFILGKK